MSKIKDIVKFIDKMNIDGLDKIVEIQEYDFIMKVLNAFKYNSEILFGQVRVLVDNAICEVLLLHDGQLFIAFDFPKGLKSGFISYNTLIDGLDIVYVDEASSKDKGVLLFKHFAKIQFDLQNNLVSARSTESGLLSSELQFCNETNILVLEDGRKIALTKCNDELSNCVIDSDGFWLPISVDEYEKILLREKDSGIEKVIK